MARKLFAATRALVAALAFLSLWMYFVPRWFGGPHAFDSSRPLGWIIVAVGAVISLPCIWEFAWRGLGTPAPFDPPRRLVITGPYRWVRNPMYLGAGLVLLGAAMFYGSFGLALYTIVFWSMAHLFVLFYEEPILRKKFGSEYEAYTSSRRRWMPLWRS